jgi:type IV secretory pathway component VirB8
LALDAPATYLNWNFILISIPNLLMIVGMVVVFVIAMMAPFPSHAEVVVADDSNDE